MSTGLSNTLMEIAQGNERSVTVETLSQAARTSDHFTTRLLTEAGVATIPLSPFYAVPPSLSVLRLCIAKQDSTLDAAAQRLNEFAARLA